MVLGVLAHLTPSIFFSRFLRSEALVYNSYIFFRTAILRKLFDIRFLHKGCDPFNQTSNLSDREKWSTSKAGPVFSKLFWLDRTDPLSFGPKFSEILIEWITPKHCNFSCVCLLVEMASKTLTRSISSCYCGNICLPLIWQNKAQFCYWAKKRGRKEFLGQEANPRPPTCQIISKSTVPRQQMLNSSVKLYCL